MDGVSEGASIGTLIQLATTIISYVKSVIDAPVHKRKLLTALIETRGLLSTLVDLTNEVEDDDWSHTIQSLSARNGPLFTFQELLEQMATKLGVTYPGVKITTVINRLRWPFEQASFQDIISSLGRLKSHFLLAMANDHIRLSKAILNELHEVQRTVTEATLRTRRQIILSLSKEQELIVKSLSLGTLSQELDGSKVMERRATTECFLLHNAFKLWHDASPTPHTLVLTGRPGSGKSSICQVTRFFLKAWHQPETDVCVAYFAFNFSQREKLTNSMVLSNIVQQILLERPYLMEHVADMRVTGGPLSSIESLDLISRARRDLEQFYLILDGLDECEKTSRDVVEALVQIDPPLSILVAGREPDMSSGSLQDSSTVCTDDITTLSDHLGFIRKMLGENSRTAAFLDHSPENISKAAKLIFEQSNWLWTCTTAILESLAQSETRPTFERLLYNGGPSSLTEFYELKLDDVMHQSAQLAALAKRVLKEMLDARGSVSVSQLTNVMTLELTDVASAQRLGRGLTQAEITEAIRSSCKEFVSASELGTSKLQFHLVHESARGFLETHGISE